MLSQIPLKFVGKKKAQGEVNSENNKHSYSLNSERYKRHGQEEVARRNDEIKLSINGMPDGEFDIEGLMNSLKVEMRSLAVSAGTVMIEAIMDSESEQLAGKRYSRRTDIDRWGTESGYVLLGGQKVRVRRPRLRNKDKQEVSLTSYEQFQNESQRTESVFNRLVAGVSTRNYARTVEEFGDGPVSS